MEQGGSPIKTVLGSLAIAGDSLNIGGVRSLHFEDEIQITGYFLSGQNYKKVPIKSTESKKALL